MGGLIPGRTSPSFRGVAALLLGLAAGGCRAASRPGGLLWLVDDAGDTVSVPAPAHRIASLIPATTELLFAIGAGKNLVGRTTWCDYPPAAAAAFWAAL